LEAGVLDKKRISEFLRAQLNRSVDEYSLYRRRYQEMLEINPTKDAIVMQLRRLATSKSISEQDMIGAHASLRKKFALLIGQERDWITIQGTDLKCRSTFSRNARKGNDARILVDKTKQIKRTNAEKYLTGTAMKRLKLQ